MKLLKNFPLLFSFLLLFCSKSNSQASFEKELKSIFLNMPIDSSFQYIVNYSLAKKYSFIDEKSMDSPNLVFVSGQIKNNYLNNKATSGRILLMRSDSLYYGGRIRKHCFGIGFEFRYTFNQYKRAKKDFDRIIAKIGALANHKCERQISSLKPNIGKEVMFYTTENSEVPSLTALLLIGPMDGKPTIEFKYLNTRM